MSLTDLIPEGFRLELSCFVTSPSTEAEAKISLGGNQSNLGNATKYAEMGKVCTDLLNEALTAANDGEPVTDARLMTSEEIKDYLKRSEDDMRDSGLVVVTDDGPAPDEAARVRLDEDTGNHGDVGC